MASPRSSLSLLPPLVEETVRQEAADIILTFGSFPALRRDGTLIPLDQFGQMKDVDLEGLVREIVPESKRPILEKERQVDLAYAHGEYRFRVNVFFQRGHLSLAMRYVKNRIPSIEELGLPALVKDLVENDNGLILLVGPTGSGKSTSMAAMIDHLNTNFKKHIVTIEDPIEYVYENKQSIIEQREVGIDATDFPSALRAVLREAPDVIMLGEMRDLESISAAITVAETGHLVLSTVHANNAPGSVDRIIDVFPAGYKEQIRIQLADILLAVLNQRLVPKADGSGSLLVTEVMIANSAVRSAIRSSNSAQLPTIIQTSASEGMFLLDDLLVKAAKRGEINRDEALANANDRTEVKKGLALG